MADLEDLARQIEALSPPDRLRLAAAMLEAKKPELAYRVAERVVLELGAALALKIPRPTPTETQR